MRRKKSGKKCSSVLHLYPSLELLSYILTHIEDNENVIYAQEEDTNASIRQSVEPDIINKDPNLQL